MSSYKTKPKPGTQRFNVSQIIGIEHPKYALFLRSKSGKNAKFESLIDDEQTALEVAREFAAKVAGRGESDFTYYVIEIKHRVGIEHGKLVDIATP